MTHGGKPFFPFWLHIHVKFGRIVICSYTLNIKTPVQLTTLNVRGATCDLFYLSMGIYHGKFTFGNIAYTHLMQFPVVRGSFTTIKRAQCNRHQRERISWEPKSKHVSPVTVFSSATWGLITRTLQYLHLIFITTTRHNACNNIH